MIIVFVLELDNCVNFPYAKLFSRKFKINLFNALKKIAHEYICDYVYITRNVYFVTSVIFSHTFVYGLVGQGTSLCLGDNFADTGNIRIQYKISFFWIFSAERFNGMLANYNRLRRS